MLNRLDPILLLLFIGILIFTGLLFLSDRVFPMDGQTFQVISALVSVFAGAFFTRIKPKPDPGDHPTTAVATITTPDGTTEAKSGS